jgi:hypothetical protein
VIRIAILSDTHGQLDPRIAALVLGCDLSHLRCSQSTEVRGFLRLREFRLPQRQMNNQ